MDDNKCLNMAWYPKIIDTQIEPGETSYHTKLRLLNDKIVKLEQYQHESNNQTEKILKQNLEFRFKQIEKDHKTVLTDYKSLLTIIVDLKKQLSIKDTPNILEDRLNKLEEQKRELRKIIDELRPTPSKYM